MKKHGLCVLILVLSISVYAQQTYPLGPSSKMYEGIPKGKLSKHVWESKIYPNTIREYYIYVPAQYDSSQAAALMIFQDGHTYVKEDGDFRVPIVFDNLISQGQMPVTIGLFINPGHDTTYAPVESPWQASNRRNEYDEITDTYGRFLLEEMIPELQKIYHISDDRKMRAIGGISSGGICAFSAAWFFPDQFQKVLSHIGSFTDIKGGHNYPSMIRKNDHKDIKVFMQDGTYDLNNQFGNWWLANQQMASALAYKDYDYKFVEGEGEHNGNHGGAILPQSLIWLWHDELPTWVASNVYALPKSNADHVFFEGESAHLANTTFESHHLNHSDNEVTLFDEEHEQIIIIKEGELNIKLKRETKTLGPNSVVVLMPGDKAQLVSKAPESIYYCMRYIAKHKMNTRRGKKNGGSQIIDFEQLTFREHDKGGRRDYFNRATSMCPYYEMHLSNLNAGIKSHEPHTHRATEIILMIEGETEMEIGNQVYTASSGDLYFVSSNVPHAIRNIGESQCMYFAFQWE